MNKKEKFILYKEANELLRENGYETKYYNDLFKYSLNGGGLLYGNYSNGIETKREDLYQEELTDNGLIDKEREETDIKYKKLLKEKIKNINTILRTPTKIKEVDTLRGKYKIKDYEVGEGNGYSERKGRYVGDEYGELVLIRKKTKNKYECKCKKCGNISTYLIIRAKHGKCKNCNPEYKKIKIGDIINTWKVIKEEIELGRIYYKVICTKCKVKSILTNNQIYNSKSCKCLKKH